MGSKTLIEQTQPKFQPNLELDSPTTFSKEQEWENADHAVLDFRATGQTKRHCLRCGGNFNFVDAGSAFRISCEREGCFEETLRGI